MACDAVSELLSNSLTDAKVGEDDVQELLDVHVVAAQVEFESTS
jgi:hypothetical protein